MTAGGADGGGAVGGSLGSGRLVEGGGACRLSISTGGAYRPRRCAFSLVTQPIFAADREEASGEQRSAWARAWPKTVESARATAQRTAVIRER